MERITKKSLRVTVGATETLTVTHFGEGRVLHVRMAPRRKVGIDNLQFVFCTFNAGILCMMSAA
jgi:hypothetical protein